MTAEEAAAEKSAREPKLSGAPAANTAANEEDEMLAALKHAIKPDKS